MCCCGSAVGILCEYIFACFHESEGHQLLRRIGEVWMKMVEKYGVDSASRNPGHQESHQKAILAYKAAVTNDPVKLLGDIKINMSPEARRWRDLWNHYASRLGNKINGEKGTRSIVSSHRPYFGA